MASRREFLKTGAAALTVAAARPLFGWQGANDRVRMGVIGMGTRAARVFDSLTRNQDCQFTWAAKSTSRSWRISSRPTVRLPRSADRRRLPQSARPTTSIDAVLIATPGFLAQQDLRRRDRRRQARLRREADLEHRRAHQRDARRLQQGPNLVVQVGTHQRSWDHFIEAKKMLRMLDPVTHVLIQQPGAYSAQQQDPVPVPTERSTGTRGRWTRPRRRSSRAISASAAGGSTAAAWWATGARTTSTSRTGS